MKFVERALGIGVWSALVGLISAIIGYLFGLFIAVDMSIHNNDLWRKLTETCKKLGM